jgi:hypothetical protein
MSARVRPILIATLLVLSGGVLSLFIERMVVPHHAPGSAAAPHSSIVAQIDSTLRLTPAQRDSVHAIFTHHQPMVDSAWRSINRRMHATMDSVHNELVRVLEADQVAAFHQLMRRQHGGRPARH